MDTQLIKYAIHSLYLFKKKKRKKRKKSTTIASQQQQAGEHSTLPSRAGVTVVPYLWGGGGNRRHCSGSRYHESKENVDCTLPLHIC